jgi:hypothetical protein
MKTVFRRNNETGWWEYHNGTGWVNGQVKDTVDWMTVRLYWLSRGMPNPVWERNPKEQ